MVSIALHAGSHSALVTGGTGGLGAAVVARLPRRRLARRRPVDRRARARARRRARGPRARPGRPVRRRRRRARRAASRRAGRRRCARWSTSSAASPRRPACARRRSSDFEAQFALNLRPTYLVCAGRAPGAARGAAAARSSASPRARALQPFAGAAGYAASKAAVLAFAQALEAEYARRRRALQRDPARRMIDTPANRAVDAATPSTTSWCRRSRSRAVILHLCSDESARRAAPRSPSTGARR